MADSVATIAPMALPEHMQLCLALPVAAVVCVGPEHELHANDRFVALTGMCARPSLGEEEGSKKLKPLERTLRRIDRRPGKVATTRNRVLRGRRETGAAKRTQGVQLLRDRASKAQSLGASAVC
jgi:hypothetical protein